MSLGLGMPHSDQCHADTMNEGYDKRDCGWKQAFISK